MFTMKNKWILFSYSIPAANAKARMRTWRRISATGAAQLKTGLQILPYREELMETNAWLIGEVNSLGGEAIALQCQQVQGMSDQQIERLFQAQVDAEFAQIQVEAESLLAAEEPLGAEKDTNEASVALRKLRKRCEGVRERDFFPSGAAARTLKALDAISARLRRPARGAQPAATRETSQYQGRVWVTRARPYIDRLGSAWLIQRFIDPQASFRFLLPGQTASLAQGELPFDMAIGDFTHRGELITFEVLLDEFALADQALEKLAELVKAIDIQEGALAEDAALLKTLLDGLVALVDDDHRLLEKARLLFDALYAGYAKTTWGEKP